MKPIKIIGVLKLGGHAVDFLSYAEKNVSGRLAVKDRLHGGLLNAHNSCPWTEITPALEKVMIGQNQMGPSRGFIGKAGKTDHQGNLLQGLGKTAGLGQSKDGIRLMEKKNLDLVLVHVLDEIEDFLIGGQLVQGRGNSESEGLSQVACHGIEQQNGQFQGHGLLSCTTDPSAQRQGG